jgi:hypothetical protein
MNLDRISYIIIKFHRFKPNIMMKHYVKGWPIACVLLLLLLMTSFNATMVPKVNGEMYYYDSYYTSNENLVSKVGIAKNNASNNSSGTSTVSTNSTGPSINNNGNSKCSISAPVNANSSRLNVNVLPPKL